MPHKVTGLRLVTFKERTMFSRDTRSLLGLAGAVLCLAAALGASPANAATLYWDGGTEDILTDGDGVSQGGAGTWDTTILNWDAGASPHVAWVNANNDTAEFAGTAGTVTLGTGITVGGLIFKTNNYILSGASTLTLDGTTPTITTGYGVTATIGNNTATVIDGTVGLTKRGVGTLTLNGSAVNTFTGGLNVNGGTLALNFANMADADPTDLVNSGNALTIGGSGILSITGKSTGTTSQTLGDVTVNSGGGRILGNKNGGTALNINLGTLTATASGGSLLVGAGGTAVPLKKTMRPP
jgi:fibronectin-binding autotransporter adhesin